MVLPRRPGPRSLAPTDACSAASGPRPAPGRTVRRRCASRPRSSARSCSTGSIPRGSPAPGATGGSRATMSMRRWPPRRRSASASRRPRSRAIGDIPHDRMRLKIAENMVRATSEAPHVTALFEADFSAIAAHKKALADEGRQAQLHRLSGQGRGRGDGGRAGDQRALGKRPHRGVAVGQHRRRDRAWRQGAGGAGGQGRRGAVARGDRRASSTTSRAAPAPGSLTGGDVSGGSFTISNHGVSGSLLAAPIILHAGQAAILGVGKLEKRVVVRDGRRAGRDPDPADGLCHADHRPPRRRRAPDQRLAAAASSRSSRAGRRTEEERRWMHATVLTTMASIAASLVGFSGLLTAFRTANDTPRPARPQQYPHAADPQRQRVGVRAAAAAARGVARGRGMVGCADGPARRQPAVLVGAEPALDEEEGAAAALSRRSTLAMIGGAGAAWRWR